MPNAALALSDLLPIDIQHPNSYVTRPAIRSRFLSLQTHHSLDSVEQTVTSRLFLTTTAFHTGLDQ